MKQSPSQHLWQLQPSHVTRNQTSTSFSNSCSHSWRLMRNSTLSLQATLRSFSLLCCRARPKKFTGTSTHTPKCLITWLSTSTKSPYLRFFRKSWTWVSLFRQLPTKIKMMRSNCHLTLWTASDRVTSSRLSKGSPTQLKETSKCFSTASLSYKTLCSLKWSTKSYQAHAVSNSTETVSVTVTIPPPSLSSMCTPFSPFWSKSKCPSQNATPQKTNRMKRTNSNTLIK